MKRINSAIFRGRRYRIKTISPSRAPKGIDGLCESPSEPGKTITVVIHKDDPLTTLRNIIHESLHACLWDLDEDAVDETANDIASLLNRLGYREGGQ